ncbi:DUF3558 domain-containing protein [Actinokineospora pegani]|uniref:DUF3558 domain-containing protein n=1 Tax=Actinokineospora pegani TaxID=2654637 RepID=UPI0012E9CDD8|nr:DUF3558 domain-containing protein [Actinokineospora pegani]
MALTSCAQQVPGTPVALMGGAPQDSKTAPSNPGGESDDLASLDPCDLLSETTKSALHVDGAPEPRKYSHVKACGWTVHDDPLVPSGYHLGIAVYPEKGIDDAVATDGVLTPVQVGRHRGVQYFGAGKSVCSIALEVTATSRIDISGSGNDDAGRCPAAERAARLIEPDLP